MKLKVAIAKTVARPDGAVVLIDENGELLPGQVSSTLETSVHGVGRLTVEFCIDGEDVVMEKTSDHSIVQAKDGAEVSS